MSKDNNFFASLTCPICLDPLISSVIMSDGTFIHKSCATSHLSQTKNPKSLTTNLPLTSSTLIPNEFINRLFKDHIEKTNNYDEYICSLTLADIERFDLHDLITSSTKFNKLMHTQIAEITKRNDQQLCVNITQKIFDLVLTRDEEEIVNIISSSHGKYINFSSTTIEGDNTLLIFACQKKLIKFSLWLIDNHHIDINYRNKNGATALIWATYNNLPAVCTALINQNAEINHIDELNYTALMWACKNNMVDVAQLLLANPDIQLHHTSKSKTTALIWAGVHNMTSIVQLILNYSSNKNICLNQINSCGRTVLMNACKSKHINIVSSLLQQPNIDVNIMVNCQSALSLAYEYGWIDIILLLLSNKNLIIKSTESILCWACENNHSQLALKILTHPNFDGVLLDYCDKYNKNALAYTQKNKMSDVKKLILALSPNVSKNTCILS